MVITPAPFADASALTKAVLRSLKGVSVTPDELRSKFADTADMLSRVPELLNRILAMATSDEIEAAAFKCAARALYVPAGSPVEFAGIRVDRSLFDDPDHGASAREDYLGIVFRIIEVNCRPFLARALSGFAVPKAAGTSEDPK